MARIVYGKGMSLSIPAERGARVSFPPPVVFLSGILLGVACRYAIAPAPVPLGRTPGLVAGAGAIALGVALIASARILFLRTGQSPIPWKPTPELIFEGPYRLTRNPMYLGATAIVVGLGLALDNLWISAFAAPALAAVHFMAVLPEERYLLEKFGDNYGKYLARVRRYL
jgi:protein-S-isoprenylcysteine O-methyltransferase Ste14